MLAFESDKTEFSALKRNTKGRTITPIQRALWKESGEMTFFDKNAQGDSSLIDPGDADASYTVKTQRLDDVAELQDSPVRLIKLEAEGVEPEILEGMTATLARTDYVSVDMGPERGISGDNTVSQATDILYKAGFHMIGFFPPRCTALFERIK